MDTGDYSNFSPAVVLVTGMLGKMRGLLFQNRDLPFKGCLVLTGCHDVHTFGMRDPIDVAFVDSHLSVRQVYRDVQPWRRVHCKGTVLTIERFSKPGPWLESGNQLICGKKDEL